MLVADKITHYRRCYKASNWLKYIPVIHQIWCLIIFLAVTLGKEFIWDLCLRQGKFELMDIKANWMGCFDSAIYRKMRY